MWKIIIYLAAVSVLVYYVSLALFVLFPRAIALTNRKLKFYRCVIPFYYWFAPSNERKKETPKEEPQPEKKPAPGKKVKAPDVPQPASEKRKPGRPKGSTNKKTNV